MEEARVEPTRHGREAESEGEGGEAQPTATQGAG